MTLSRKSRQFVRWTRIRYERLHRKRPDLFSGIMHWEHLNPGEREKFASMPQREYIAFMTARRLEEVLSR